ncbi:BQ5605_C020g09071 [Microbotryum silenes-dioicae]|uniref:BQ5605_C020g09071 protein n=1 Tax=Microbotryum silenes-dioicae TaxID=796604 RepID=A0A2X0N5H9_9BASI|nr:BQ5605_C020g09071 [Microbotryum silenes-dioicae]
MDPVQGGCTPSQLALSMGTSSAVVDSKSASSSIASGSTATGLPSSQQNGTARRKGRQVQDVNHLQLLGFTLPPRSTPPLASAPRRSNKRDPAYHGSFDRARYIHTFRFVVKPDKDYTANLADHDVRLDWADVLQVILPTASSALSTVLSSIATVLDQQPGSAPTCPICLSEPTAPRMVSWNRTKCGHVFCFPCILHYLALADGQKWRKCPVCWDSVYATDLKVVKWHDAVTSAQYDSSPTADLAALSIEDLSHSLLHDHSRNATAESLGGSSGGEPLKMRLIRRPKISTLALPRSDTWPSEAVPPLRAPWNFSPDAFVFAKFMLGSPEYLKEELDQNMRDLEQEVSILRQCGRQGGTDEELGIVFVRAATVKVSEQLQKVGVLKTTSVMTARKKALKEIQEIRDRPGKLPLGPSLPLFSETSSSEVEDAPSELLGIRSLNGGRILSGDAPVFQPGGPGARARPQRKNVNPAPALDADSTYYFYQAASGQNIYLHPLDIKILKSHFGTYQGMPDVISVKVEGADEGSMNDDLRRRCRWLAHLPTSCDVVFIEADLTSVVPGSSLEPFSHALKQRRTKRRDKARREDKAKLKSEQKEVEARPVYMATYGSVGTGHNSWSNVPMTTASTQQMMASTTAFPPPSSGSNPGSSGGDAHGFPSSVSPTRPAPISTWGYQAPSTAANTQSFAAPRSFASALHSSSRPSPSRPSQGHDLDDWDDAEFDERWHDFEDRLHGASSNSFSSLNLKRGASRGGGSASGSNAGGGAAGKDGSATPKQSFGGKKKGRKAALTLNLSGAAMRGTG